MRINEIVRQSLQHSIRLTGDTQMENDILIIIIITLVVTMMMMCFYRDKTVLPSNVMSVSKRYQGGAADEGPAWPTFQAKCEALRTFICDESHQEV